MRTKIDYRSGSKSSYSEFCKRNPHVKISFDKYYEVINVCNKMFANEILETGNRLKLPFGFGDLSINKRKTAIKVKYLDDNKEEQERITLPIDWQKSREKGKHIYMLNDHTNGYRFKWLWFKHSAIFQKAKELWVFKPCRDISRRMASNLKKNYEYQEIYREWYVKYQSKFNKYNNR